MYNYIHHTRLDSASTSKPRLHVPIGTVLKTGGRAACTHSQNIYNKLIRSEHQFAHAILRGNN